jgi:hypothetical protein
MNSSEFSKWFIAGIAAAAGYNVFSILVGFINAWQKSTHDEKVALTEIASMTYFPRLRVFPDNLRRFATLHNVRILDVLFLGNDDETSTIYYYIHGHTPTFPCCAMLVKQTQEGTIQNLTYSDNRVAAALVAKCSEYVHDISQSSMLSMFVARVMTSHDRTDNRESVTNDIVKQGE